MFLEGLLLGIRRRFRRRCRVPKTPATKSRAFRFGHSPTAQCLLLGLIISAVLIGALELRLRPVAERLCTHHVNNLVTRQVNNALLNHLTESTVSYSSLISVDRDSSGAITALSSNMVQINLLRTQMIDAALDAIGKLDIHDLGIPLGSLFDSDLLWGKGPLIHVRGLVGGTVNARVRSDFSGSGINQTLHRILLDLEIPLSVLLPGITASTVVNVSVCMAETVIVGSVPETFLQLGE